MTARRAVRYAFAAFFAAAGAAHLAYPGFFLRQVPGFLPARGPLVAVTGVCFAAGAAGLLLRPPVRRAAAVCLLLLLLAVWPGNVWGALEPGSYLWPGAPNALDWARVPLQVPLLALLWWANADVLARRRRGTSTVTGGAGS